MSETTDATPTETTPSAEEHADERPSLNASVGSAAALIGAEHFGNGDRAALRRISPEASFTPALWKVLHQIGQHDAPDWISQKEWERRWATLLMGLAFCVEPGRTLHEYDVPLGRALFAAGWSELRFVRLLRSTGEGLDVELRRVAQYLDSKAQPANWADVARLLFYQSGDTADDIRLSIARDYYGARYAAEQAQSE
jgi:CRISPR system Cascade subunit CasB